VVKNSKQALEHGSSVSDTIATWISKKFVAGPFNTPPLSHFRVNSILAVPQPNKTRVCINVSLPEGKSFNDNIEKTDLEKVRMSSARLFAYKVMEAGPGSIMAKSDIVDAYKNIPACSKDLRLQGFSWEGKFFIELRQMFGACSAVQNFDIMANTVRSLALANCSIPSRFVLRQLDDVPVVGPAASGWCEDFLAAYKQVCERINLQLAPDCPKFDKSFGPTTYGKVLGIWFDTTTLCWKLPVEKISAALQSISSFLTSPQPSLLETQSLMGRLNNVATMCPFMNIFKFNLNEYLAMKTKNIPTTLEAKARKDLQVWANMLLHPTKWIPIHPEKTHPPLATIKFFSDAAGMADNGKRSGNIGCGVIGMDPDGNTLLGYQMWWPESFITTATDIKGKRFGNKTTTLEMIGILLPLLLIPEKLRNSHIELFTDNMGCVFGMKDGYVKNDEYASIFIRAAYLIGAYLGSVLHVAHIPRRSSWETESADNLSRSNTTSFLEKQILSRYDTLSVPPNLTNWLENPTNNWDLALDLLKYVMEKTK
jgi:hypothetical protein